MGSVRILNDGDRFYIVIENPTEKDKQAAIDFVAQLIGAKKEAETPKSVPPAKVEPFTVPENMAEVSSQNEKLSIPKIESPTAFTEWYLKMNSLSDENKADVLKECNRYMRSYLRGSSRRNIERIKKFMLDFQQAMPEDINNVLKKNAYSDLTAFLEVERDENIQAAYDVCKKNLCASVGLK